MINELLYAILLAILTVLSIPTALYLYLKFKDSIEFLIKFCLFLMIIIWLKGVYINLGLFESICIYLFELSIAGWIFYPLFKKQLKEYRFGGLKNVV